MRRSGSSHVRLEDQNLLDLTPVRLAGWWRRADGRVVVETPRPARGAGWRRRLGYLLTARRVRLDELGSLVWRCCDGGRTVAELCVAVRAASANDCEPLEERLGIYLGHLRRGGFLGYQDWDEGAVASQGEGEEPGRS